MIGVKLELFLTTRTGAATQSNTIFTLSRLKMVPFLNRTQCLQPKFSNMKNDSDRRFSLLEIKSMPKIKFEI